MSRLVIFPPTKKGAAETYKAEADALYAATYEPNGIFTYDPRADKYGNWVVAYYGPDWTFDGTEFVEPESMIAFRVDGVVQDTADWPDEI